jgi:hypothetical protein
MKRILVIALLPTASYQPEVVIAGIFSLFCTIVWTVTEFV